MPERSHVQSEVVDGVLVLTVTEEQLRGDVLADDVRTEFLDAVAKANLKRVVIDLGKVEMFTSPAFRPLLSLRKLLHEMGEHRLVLCGLRPEVSEVFRITRMIDTRGSSSAPFEVQRDRASAVAAAKQA